MSEVDRFRGFADLVGLQLEDFQLEVMEAVLSDRREISVASEPLVRLRALLRSRAPVYAQGLAMLRQVLRDGGSAWYLPAWPGALAQAIEEIIVALEGRDRSS
jgi:hypothetical protein